MVVDGGLLRVTQLLANDHLRASIPGHAGDGGGGRQSQWTWLVYPGQSAIPALASLGKVYKVDTGRPPRKCTKWTGVGAPDLSTFGFRTWALFRDEESRHPTGGFFGQGGQAVGVAVQGDADVGVPQTLGDDLGMHSRPEGQGGVRVPEVMQTDPG
jgi:hypothetical protein